MDIFVKCDVLQPCFHCTHGNGHQSQVMNNLPWSQISRRCWKQLSAMQRSLSNGWQYILTTQTSCHLHSWLAMVMKSQIMLLNLINLSACSLLAEFLSESRHVDVMTEDWFSYAFCFVAYTFQAMTFRFYLDFYKGIASTCMFAYWYRCWTFFKVGQWITCGSLRAMRSRTVSTSVKQQRGQTQSLALCPASSWQMQMQSHMQGQMDLQMRQMISSISSVVAQGVRSAMGLEDENLDSPPSRAVNLQFLKPKAKQTPSPPPAESQPVLLSKVAGSSFPALGDQAPVEASASHPEPADPAGRKDEEADPSPFASERKSALRHPAGSKAAALSPNKVKFDPVTHSMDMASAMKEILDWWFVFVTSWGLLCGIVCCSCTHMYIM